MFIVNHIDNTPSFKFPPGNLKQSKLKTVLFQAHFYFGFSEKS
jgi:hypothetical protein